MSSVICQFRVWINSPAALTSGQPFWIRSFPTSCAGEHREKRDTRCAEESRAEACLLAHPLPKFKKKRKSFLSLTQPHLFTSSSVLRSCCFTLRWSIYLSSLFCTSLFRFKRFLGQIWRLEVWSGSCLNKRWNQSHLQPDQTFTFKRNVIPFWKRACCSSCGNYYRFTCAYHFLLSTSFFVFHALSKSCTWIGLKLNLSVYGISGQWNENGARRGNWSGNVISVQLTLYKQKALSLFPWIIHNYTGHWEVRLDTSACMAHGHAPWALW